MPGFDGNSGIVLRTGRDGRAYQEARNDIKNGMKNKSQPYMRYCTLTFSLPVIFICFFFQMLINFHDHNKV